MDREDVRLIRADDSYRNDIYDAHISDVVDAISSNADGYGDDQIFMNFGGIIDNANTTDTANNSGKTLQQILREKQEAIDAEERRIKREGELYKLKKSREETIKIRDRLEKAIWLGYRMRLFVAGIISALIVIVLFMLSINYQETIGAILIISVMVFILLVAIGFLCVIWHVGKKMGFWLDKPVPEIMDFIEQQTRRYM